MAAREARKMMRRLYYPADSAMVRTITGGALLECRTTGRDVVLATDIYGKDVASLKAKTKERKPEQFKTLMVPTMSQKEQTVYADIFHWRNVDFVLFIVKPLRLVLVQLLHKTDVPNMRDAVLTLCNKVESRGYAVEEIVVDPEKALAGLVNVLPRPVTVVGSRSHVADAEVEIRTVKERIRASTHGLPYDLPRRLVKWQVYGAVMTFNMLLRQGQTVSSRELFTGVKTNYKRDVRAEFGEYVQAHVAPQGMSKRGPEERTVGAIALCSADNQKGTYWFFGLKKRAYFRADKWTALPITDDVIALMNKIYDDDQPNKAREANRRRNRRLRVDPADRDLTRELLELPTERDPVNVVTHQDLEELDHDGSNDEVINEDVVDEDREDDEDSSQDEQDEETTASAIQSYKQALARVGEAQNALELHNMGITMSDETGTANLMESNGDDDPDDESVSEDVEGSGEIEEPDVISMEEPYDNLMPQLGSRFVGGRRRSQRIDSKRRIEARILHAHRISVKKALKKNEHESKKSILKELKQMVDMEVWEIIQKANLTRKQLRKVIRSSMFLTEKFTATGEFDKLKARLVAGGDGQDKTLYNNLSSPTISQETVMMVLAIAAIEGRSVATIDITGAYLECVFDDDEVIMTIDPFLAKLLAQIDPSVEQKKDDKGMVYVKLRKALYGCIQSAKLWYDKLCEVLEADGYEKNGYDACLFNKMVNGVQCTIGFHVDDLLITCKDSCAIDALEKTLKENFKSITVNRGTQHSYLAMNMVVGEDGISLDMSAYIRKLLDGRKVKQGVNSPATDDLFEVPEDGVPLSDEDKKVFHTDVAKLLYLAKRTRGQILTAVSHLSGSRIFRCFYYVCGKHENS